MANEERKVAEMQDGEIVPVYDYHYTGSQPPQIGGNGPIIGSTWTTAHDDIKLTEGLLPDRSK